ncbi:MAG: 1-acyl-sn-glycerol-3-phosphate acyltransferase [Gemmatimonadales bacterium]
MIRGASVEAVPPPFDRGWPLRGVLIPFARGLKHVYRARTIGVERIPTDRPVIYVGKHPRTWLYLETLVLGLVTFWDSDRPPFRALEEQGTSMHRTPIVGWFRRHVNSIPATEAAALGVLARGESLLVFPGGTRELYGEPDTLRWSGRTGFARLALAARVAVQPFAIIGADQQHPARLRLRGSSIWLPPLPLPVRLDYHFGVPIEPEGSPDSRGDVAALAASVHDATRRLLDAGVAMRHARSPVRA